MIAAHSERLHRPVLVLNSSYEPINVCAARRALVLVLKGVAAAEEHASAHVHSARQAMRFPSVIRLLEYRRIPHQTRALSRKNILMRDRYTCQYCLQDPQLRRADARSRDAAFARRRNHVGEPGGLLPSLQQSQRQPHAGGSRHAPGARAHARSACTPAGI